MEKKVAIIILTCNQKKMLEETLESLIKKMNYKNYKIFLVDNGSADRHDLMVKKEFPKVDITRNKENLGFSKANNIGIKKASKYYNPEYFLLMNDDMEVSDKDFLKKMIKVAEQDSKIGVVGCQQIYPDGTMQDVGGYFRKWNLTKILKFKQGEILDVDLFMGSCMLIKKEVMKKIGGLDEGFTPFLLEDSDYCLTAKKAGYLVKVVTDTKIIHKKSKTVNSFTNSKHMFVRFKNDIYFSIKHMTLKYALFRIFIYLPLVAVFRKKRDEERLSNLRNFAFRKEAINNIFLLIGAYFYSLTNIGKIKNKNYDKKNIKKN
ncbi:MAG TPA: glycosyltransferase family 2 protein [Candidatus Pacearchaeota archaeon]|nr:glycosyltransferase family 2 protein [Candidatus Pacearchaeota archaeon]